MMAEKGRNSSRPSLLPSLFSTNSQHLIRKEVVQRNGFCSEFPQKPCLSKHSFPGAMSASLWLPLWGGAELWGEGNTREAQVTMESSQEASHIPPFNKYEGSTFLSTGHAGRHTNHRPRTPCSPARGATQAATVPGWGTLTDPSCAEKTPRQPSSTAVPKGNDFLDPEQE